MCVSGEGARHVDKYLQWHRAECLQSLARMLADVDPTWQQLRQREWELNASTQDILHEIELAQLPPEAIDALHLYNELQDIRMERRACLKAIEMLQPLRYYLLRNPGLCSDIDEIIKAMQTTLSHQSNRRYTPRIRGQG